MLLFGRAKVSNRASLQQRVGTTVVVFWKLAESRMAQSLQPVLSVEVGTAVGQPETGGSERYDGPFGYHHGATILVYQNTLEERREADEALKASQARVDGFLKIMSTRMKNRSQTVPKRVLPIATSRVGCHQAAPTGVLLPAGDPLSLARRAIVSTRKSNSIE